MALDIIYNPYDALFYQERLLDFLPDEMIDIHTHVWLDSFRDPTAGTAPRGALWPRRVAFENTADDLLETYHLLFPGKHVTPMIFGFPDLAFDLEKQNRHIAGISAARRLPALALTKPEWDAGKFENEILQGRFLGCKVYLDYADPAIPSSDIRIYDFLPPHQLAVADRHQWIIMLHIPRAGRLKDPENITQLLEIDRRYPGARVIVAHVGRAYCPEDLGDALDALSGTRLYFDISANTNATVFEELIRKVGPDRILYGSDLPILRMRSRRICENGNYVNLVPAGLYGDVSGDPHMREVPTGQAGEITYFLYEEISAFRTACERTGLGKTDVEQIFRDNARSLLNQNEAGGN